MEKLQKGLFWAIVLSETSHVFCCVLPTLFSAVSLLAGLGVMSALPPGMLAFHAVMHKWEIPMLAVSAAILLFGWALQRVSLAIDCRDNGCGHGPCDPKKKNASLVLKVATMMFAANTAIYFIFHYHHGG